VAAHARRAGGTAALSAYAFFAMVSTKDLLARLIAHVDRRGYTAQSRSAARFALMPARCRGAAARIAP